jgi:hypothetical protein
MAIGKRKPQQKSMWISEHQLPKGKGHPFSTRLNKHLEKDGFDSWFEELCAPCFAAKGRPSIPPGVYFWMLFIGHLEDFASTVPLPGTVRTGSPCVPFWVFHSINQRLTTPASAYGVSGCRRKPTGLPFNASSPSCTVRD